MSEGRDGLRATRECVEAARRGDLESFEELVRRYQRGVCVYIHTLAQDWHLAQDVAQETFLAAHRRIETLREARSFSTWLYRIAHRQAVNAVRNRDRRARLTAEAARHRARESRHTYDAGWMERDEVRDTVREALESLRGEWASPLVLRYYEEMTCREIAEVLGIEVENVRIRLYRGRRALRQMLARRVHAGGVERDEVRRRRTTP